MGMDISHPASIPGGVNGVLLSSACLQIPGRYHHIIMYGGEIDASCQTCSRHCRFPSQLIDFVLDVAVHMFDIPFLAKPYQEIRDRLSLFNRGNE